MRFGILGGLVLLLSVLGCGKEKPVSFRDEQMGIAVVFPGAPERSRYAETTPFGRMEWFARNCRPSGGMDQNFQAEVGNLPLGNRGGTSPAEVVATYHRWLLQRFGTVERKDLDPDSGPGFGYRVRSPSGVTLRGRIVVRRGRLHRAEVTSSKPDDPKAQAFLDSFTVLP